MEQKVNFNVEKVGDTIVFVQKAEKIIPYQEAQKELTLMKRELSQLEQQEAQMKDELKKKTVEKNIKTLQEQISKLKEVEKDWGILVKPLEDEVKDKLKKKIRKAKAKSGYDRIDNTDLRIIKQNEIIAPLCEEFKLDMGHPIIRELKVGFDKI